MKACLGIILVTAALGLGCSPDQSTPVAAPTASAKTVAILSMQFSPATLDVMIGDVIEWKNEDLVPHTATSPSFDSGSIAPGQSWQHTFTEAGNFTYICNFHPTMKGVVSVKQ